MCRFTYGSDILLPAWMILLCALPVGLARRLDARNVGLDGVRARGPSRRCEHNLSAVITDNDGDGLIPLTTAEVRRLFSQHLSLTRPHADHKHWSRCRRRHQAIAQRCHYQRRNQLYLALLL